MEEEKDLIGDKFKTAFSNFEPEPPGWVWEGVRAELHPVPKTETLWDRLLSLGFFFEKRTLRYAVFAGIVLVMVLTVIYFGSESRYKIHGHAYAGENRLSHGTAVLFRVSDKVIPWDSASYYRSAIINGEGQYEFKGVVAGKYLLRVSPETSSPAAENFKSSWFEHHESADSCPLIIVAGSDEKADVHLLRKTN